MPFPHDLIIRQLFFDRAATREAFHLSCRSGQKRAAL